MKSITKLLTTVLIIAFQALQLAIGQTELQSGKLIPVYPGATLKTELEEGDSKMCCSFISTDGFDKVVAFYEKELKIKALDPNGLANQIPSLKPQVDEMLKQMPVGMKIRIFVLKELEFQGKKGAETFEVVYTGNGQVEFDIDPSQLMEKDSHFESEWMGEESSEEMPGDPARAKAMLPALPSTAPSGFTKEEPYIDEMTYSAVTVQFGKAYQGMDSYYSIIVSINDFSDNPENIEFNINPQSDDEKAIKVKGKYPGKEKFLKNGSECLAYDRIFAVKDRYVVIISCDKVCDMAIIDQVVDKMKLELLP
jgi:predicted heme/steroid binding protein